MDPNLRVKSKKLSQGPPWEWFNPSILLLYALIFTVCLAVGPLIHFGLSPEDSGTDGHNQLCDIIRGSCAAFLEKTISNNSSTTIGKNQDKFPTEGDSKLHTYTFKVIYNSVRILPTIFSSSFSDMSTNNGKSPAILNTKRETSRSRASAAKKIAKDAETAKEEEFNKKRARGNESFIDSPSNKAPRNFSQDSPSTRRVSTDSVNLEETIFNKEIEVMDEKFLLEEDEGMPSAKPTSSSTPTNPTEEPFSLDDTIIQPPEFLNTLEKNKQAALLKELEEFDNELYPQDFNMRSPTPIQSHAKHQRKSSSVFSLRDPKPSTSNRKNFPKPIVIFTDIPCPSTETPLQAPKAPLNIRNTSTFLPRFLRMNPAEEVRKIQEARIQRDRDFPFKVAIRSTTYHEGKDKDMIQRLEKDIIGRCLAQGQDAKNEKGVVIFLDDSMRLSAGMAIVNCKDEASSKWVIDTVNKKKITDLAKNIGTPLRDDLELIASDAISARPFKAFTAINTNTLDSWDDTMSWVRRFPMGKDPLTHLLKPQIDTSGWLLLNSRIDKSQAFTFIDTENTLQTIFDGGIQGSRVKNLLTLRSNIVLRWLIGEDERSKIKQNDFHKFFSLTSPFQSRTPRNQQAALRTWPPSWKGKLRRLIGTKKASKLSAMIPRHPLSTSEGNLRFKLTNNLNYTTTSFTLALIKPVLTFRSSVNCHKPELFAKTNVKHIELIITQPERKIQKTDTFVHTSPLNGSKPNLLHNASQSPALLSNASLPPRPSIIIAVITSFSCSHNSRGNKIIVKPSILHSLYSFFHHCFTKQRRLEYHSGNKAYSNGSTKTAGPSKLTLGVVAATVGAALISSSVGRASEETSSTTGRNKKVKNKPSKATNKTQLTKTPNNAKTDMIKDLTFRQLNIGKRIPAYTNLNTILEKDELGKNIQIIFLQELNKKATITGGSIFRTPKKFDLIRAGIYIKNALINDGNAHLLTDFTDNNHVAVDINLTLPGGNKMNVVLASWYLPSDVKGTNMITDTMDRLIGYCHHLGKELIIGADVNAKSTLWGSSTTNVRGEKLLDWIREADLRLLNTGIKPTFVPDPLEPGKRFSSIDVTLASPKISYLLNKWEVLDENSFSDHKWINFHMNAEVPTQEIIRCKKATNWKKFTDRISKSNYIKELSLLNYNLNIDELDDAAHKLMLLLVDAFKKSSKRKKKPIYKKQPWYNAELLNLRKLMRQAYRKSAKAPNREEIRVEARRLKAKYFKACDKAKRKSWRNMIEELEEVKDIARMHKFMEKGNCGKIATIKKDDGLFTTNAGETQDELMKKHFSEVTSLGKDAEWREVPPIDLKLNDEEIKSILDSTSDEIMNWAIDSFSPNKSPGVDEIFPALLQKSKDFILPILQTLFRASLITGYIPKVWRGTRVTFIPKPGKDDYQAPSAYRPISLMSFILKMLEKIIDKRIRNIDLIEEPLEDEQHAYRTGRSTESALHSVVTEAEKALENKEYCLTAFVDIMGAFDRVQLDSIISSAEELNISRWTVRWIISMLQNRRLSTTDTSCVLKYIPKIGIAQGGSLSPLIFCIVLNKLIIRLKAAGLKLSVYADDLALSVSGKIPAGLNTKMNEAFQIIEEWCQETGLDVNPSKTEMILFTNKRAHYKSKTTCRVNINKPSSNACAPNIKNKCVINDVKLKGTHIPLSNSVKYLGVYLDSKLNMNVHTNVLKEKANKALWAARSLCRRTWGLKPRKMYYIYSSIILPRILYGSLVFWHKFKDAPGNKGRLKILRTIQRKAAMMISGASRNVSTIPLLALLNLTPLEIQMERRALLTMLRLQRNSAWLRNTANHGHATLLETARKLELDHESAGDVTHWRPLKVFKTSITIRLGIKRLEGHNFFTDASVKDDLAGIGWVWYGNSVKEFQGRLENGCDNNVAEMIAIKEAAGTAIQSNIKNSVINFWTDSLRCVEALNKPLIRQKETWLCSQSLNKLGHLGNTVYVNWISKKTEVAGLLRADTLARQGRDLSGPLVINPQPKSLNTVRLKNWERLKKRRVWGSIFKLSGFNTAKTMLKGFDDERFAKISGLSKSKLRTIVALCTGAAPLNGFLSNIKRSDGQKYTDLCRFCKNSRENILHLVGDCEHWTVRSARRAAFESLDIKTKQLKNLNLQQLLSFAKKINLNKMILIRDENSIESESVSSENPALEDLFTSDELSS